MSMHKSHNAAIVADFESAFISGTAEKRHDMLLRVTDLFLTKPATLPNEQASLFHSIINRLVTHLEHRALVTLSKRLARAANAPSDLVNHLASNELIDVAGPLLGGSDMLTDENLVAIAESNSQLHLSKIAERSKLSSTVTNVIVVRGDRSVVQKVAANSGASFSKVGMSTLVLRAEGDDELIETIAARNDISPFVFGQLINYATEQARNRLMATARAEFRTALTQIMHHVSEHMTLLASSTHDWAAAQSLVNSFAQDTELTRAKVLQFADGGKIAELVVVLSVLSKIPREPIYKLICDQYGFGTMVLCKALNLDWFTAHSVLTVNSLVRTSRTMELEELQDDFESLSVSSAQQILWYWRGRTQVETAVTGTAV